jgi:hypothetical protein
MAKSALGNVLCGVSQLAIWSTSGDLIGHAAFYSKHRKKSLKYTPPAPFFSCGRLASG